MGGSAFLWNASVVFMISPVLRKYSFFSLNNFKPFINNSFVFLKSGFLLGRNSSKMLWTCTSCTKLFAKNSQGCRNSSGEFMSSSGDFMSGFRDFRNGFGDCVKRSRVFLNRSADFRRRSGNSTRRPGSLAATSNKEADAPPKQRLYFNRWLCYF